MSHPLLHISGVSGEVENYLDFNSVDQVLKFTTFP